MAITELIFPKIKTDQASIDEIERDWPKISKKLTHPNPGVLCAYRGWVLTENGRNVREENREFLLFGEFNGPDLSIYPYRSNEVYLYRMEQSGIVPRLHCLGAICELRRFN